MAKYRKISPRIWNDAKVRDLSDKGKLAFLFLLTHPTMTPFGAIRANIPGLAFELGWTPRSFRAAMNQLCEKGMAVFDEAANLIWFPNFLKYNRPESPNVIKSWAGAFEDLPECSLRDAIGNALVKLAASLGNAFLEAFREAFSEAFAESLGEDLLEDLPEPLREGFEQPSRNQEQEQEQEERKESSLRSDSCAELPDGISTPPAATTDVVISLPLNTGPEHAVNSGDVETWQELYPAVDVMQQLRNMRGWLLANPKKRKTKSGINRFIQNWLAGEQNKGGTRCATRASPNQPATPTEYQKNMQEQRQMAAMLWNVRQARKQSEAQNARQLNAGIVATGTGDAGKTHGGQSRVPVRAAEGNADDLG